MEQIYSLIHAYFGIFRHIQMSSSKFRHKQTYSGIIQTYIQAYSEPSVILAYAEPWYIQNPGIHRSRGIFKILVYQKPDILRTVVYSESETFSEPWYIERPDIFKTLVYSGTWHLQNQRQIQNPGICTTLPYSEPCQISKMEHILKGCIYFTKFSQKYFHKTSFSGSMLDETNKYHDFS